MTLADALAQTQQTPDARSIVRDELATAARPSHQSRTSVCMRCAICGSSSNSISGSASDYAQHAQQR